MAKRKKNVSVEARASAKLEAVAKATFQHKKVITEAIPPDVTRAKASAWLDIISPITEWAGLKGDVLKYKRNLLRIQQEETLLKVAHSVRAKLKDVQQVSTVPPKILVPALEGASLEEPSDDTMIDRWSNLLASAAKKVNVQPRFVGILNELSGSQARLLEEVAFNNYENVQHPYTDFGDAPTNYGKYWIDESLRELLLGKLKHGDDCKEVLELVLAKLQRPGCFLELAVVQFEGHSEDYDAVNEGRKFAYQDIHILESLRLIEAAAIDVPHREAPDESYPELILHYYHLTPFGVDFCSACSAPKVQLLRKDRND